MRECEKCNSEQPHCEYPYCDAGDEDSFQGIGDSSVEISDDEDEEWGD